MMTTDIVTQVAQLIRHKDLALKDPKDMKVRKDIIAPRDAVELSSTGESYANPVEGQPEYEKDQHMKVERLKALVQGGKYKLDDDTVSHIAERVAKMFV